MEKSFLLDPVQILKGSNESVVEDAALIIDNHLVGIGNKARKDAKAKGINSLPGPNQLLAPCLVDPHSILEEPFSGRNETIKSLKGIAAISGYGQIALLPRSPTYRDQPEKLKGFLDNQSDIKIHLWGSFSQGGLGVDLAPHDALLKNGAIGIAEDDSIISLTLLKRGLLSGEIGRNPVLMAPRDKAIQGNGIVREGVATLRAGWFPDPVESETLPLTQLLELYRLHPQCSLRLMNLSTAESIAILKKADQKPLASVCWWHLVTDNTALKPTELGWRINPSLGGTKDRKALINALKEQVITAIAVHSVPLEEEDSLLPSNQSSPGLSGHHLVLPLLWNELINNADWSINDLWQALSFGPSKLLNLPEESLRIGSRRWILFDPEKKWIQNRRGGNTPVAANQPFEGKEIKGKIIASGLKA